MTFLSTPSGAVIFISKRPSSILQPTETMPNLVGTLPLANESPDIVGFMII